MTRNEAPAVTMHRLTEELQSVTWKSFRRPLTEGRAQLADACVHVTMKGLVDFGSVLAYGLSPRLTDPGAGCRPTADRWHKKHIVRFFEARRP